MSETLDLNALFGGGEFAVEIHDLSGGNDDEPVETVRGFDNLAHANAFARRYVRDSIERCRAPATAPAAVLEAWRAFGEDAVVTGADEQGWKSASEVDVFAAERVADPEERNWRVLDPRRTGAEDDDDGDADEAGDEA